LERRKEGKKNKRKEERKEGRKDRRKEGTKEGRNEGRKERRKEGGVISCRSPNFIMQPICKCLRVRGFSPKCKVHLDR